MARKHHHKLHLQRRGSDQVNPIQLSFSILRIRLAWPPSKPQTVIGKAAAKIKYTLLIGEDEYSDTTGDDGILTETIPSDTTEATLILHLKNKSGDQVDFWRIHLLIGPLDGPYPILGIKARLNNLGLFAAETLEMDRDLDDPKGWDKLRADQTPQYHRAMHRFKNLHAPVGLTPEEQSDYDMLWPKIKEVHDGE